MAQTNGTNGSAGNGTYKVLGTRPVRHDGLDKVTGHANYGADLSLPGMLHAKFLRSPHAHARILSIDTSGAQAMPGVKAVITGRRIFRRRRPASPSPERHPPTTPTLPAT